MGLELLTIHILLSISAVAVVLALMVRAGLGRITGSGWVLASVFIGALSVASGFALIFFGASIGRVCLESTMLIIVNIAMVRYSRREPAAHLVD